MTSELAANIEDHLIHQPGDDGWFLQAALVERFQLSDDRELRADGNTPGPLSRCTIFSGRGVKHLTRATPEEIQKCQDRIDKEHCSSAFRKRWLAEGIARYVDTKTQPAVEKLTGQSLLFTP